MTQEKKTNLFWSWLPAILLIIILLSLFFQNQEETNINFLFMHMRVATNLLIPFCVFLGFLLGVLMMFSGRWRLYKTNKSLKKEIDSLKKEKDSFINP